MVSFAWTIGSFTVEPLEDGLMNVVKFIDYKLTATEGERSDYVSGSARLLPPDPDNFIPYAQVTPEIAQPWIEMVLDVEGFKNALASRVSAPEVVSDTTVVKPPPWEPVEAQAMEGKS